MGYNIETFILLLWAKINKFSTVIYFLGYQMKDQFNIALFFPAGGRASQSSIENSI